MMSLVKLLLSSLEPSIVVVMERIETFMASMWKISPVLQRSIGEGIRLTEGTGYIRDASQID